MIIRHGGLTRSSTRRTAVVALTLAFFVGLTLVTPAQEARDRQTGAPDDPMARPPALSNRLASLAAQHPSVRALVVARANCIAFEYYRKDIDAQTQSPVNSVTKSVLSILVGIAIDEGFLRLDEKLSEVFSEEFDENVDPLARDITVRDLLTKTEGFAETGQGDFKMSTPVPGKSQGWRWMINRKVEYPGGTHFRYDGIGSDLLSVVLSRTIKQNPRDFAKQRLLDPLNITNYTWHEDTEGYLHGETGLNLTARDMAKIGMLYLQHGRWEDKKIVSYAYVQDSTTKHNDGGPPIEAAYGYQWWVSKNNLGAFFAAGAKGQLIYIVPKHDLVVVVSADTSPWGSQRYFNNVVLPAAAELKGSAPCMAQYGQDRNLK
jgi:CubicO group peptidase (beta-lactamase class C family)